MASTAWWQAHGVSEKQLRLLTSSGDLVRVRRGAYATRAAMEWAATDLVRSHVLSVFAARAVIGHDAVPSHHSAATLHRVNLLHSPLPGTVTLTLPPTRRWNRQHPSDVTFHCAEVPPAHLTRLYNLPVTTVARTVIDLARTWPFRDGVVIADSALRDEKATKYQLHQVLEACARWPGAKQARKVVDFADERAGSPLESVARVVFAEAGLPLPELQVTIHGRGFAFLVDFLWPEQKVILEGDGLLKYNDRKDLIKQFERDRLLRDAGYQVVHFTWKELLKTPELVIERIRRALTRAAVTPF